MVPLWQHVWNNLTIAIHAYRYPIGDSVFRAAECLNRIGRLQPSMDQLVEKADVGSRPSDLAGPIPHSFIRSLQIASDMSPSPVANDASSRDPMSDIFLLEETLEALTLDAILTHSAEQYSPSPIVQGRPTHRPTFDVDM